MSDELRPESAPSAPKRRGKPKRSRAVLQVVVTAMAVLALVTGLSVVYIYRHLNGNLDVQSIEEELGDNRPEKVYTGNGEPLNILVMGDDTREGEGNKIDNEAGGGGSDTTILMHISGDRKRAYGVSIPRDSIVDRPTCGADDEIPGASQVMWNAAYTVGGPGCTARQFEDLTGIRIDHYVVVDFNGFRGMVDALDGVPVCVPEDIEDPAHGIRIKAGNRDLKGDEALAYVRVRYAVGDGSDIGRTRRQQEFIASMIKKVISAGTLTRIDRVVKFLDAATASLTLDEGLGSVTKMGNLAMQLQNIGMDKIQFLTIPNAYFSRDSGFWGRVYWTEDAEKVWARIRQDKPLTKDLTTGVITAETAPGDKVTPSGTPTGTPSGTTTPSDTTSPTQSPSSTPTQTQTPDEQQAAEDEAEARRAVGLCA